MVGDDHVCYRCKGIFCKCDKRLYPNICYTCKTKGKRFRWNIFYDLYEIYNFYSRFPPKGMKPLDKLCMDCFKKLTHRGDSYWTPWNNDINEESIDGYDPCRFMASEYSGQYSGLLSGQYPLNMGLSVSTDLNEENEPLRLLKIRLAKGEITLEEFNKLKDVVKP